MVKAYAGSQGARGGRGIFERETNEGTSHRTPKVRSHRATSILPPPPSSFLSTKYVAYGNDYLPYVLLMADCISKHTVAHLDVSKATRVFSTRFLSFGISESYS